MFDKPKGGTELMHDELMSRLPDNHKEQFSIENYAGYLDFNKTTILWNQLSYDQEAIAYLNDPEMVEKIDYFVFVSHWQAEMFRKIYGIPGYKTYVIKNASIGVDKRNPRNDGKVRLCYTSTPFRGLEILLAAWEQVQPKNAELHVFSSAKIYGPDYSSTEDPKYQYLYDKCEELEGVVYRGSIPNEELRKELPTFDILSYPNTFEETSCVAVIEALAAGLRVVTSNLGVLPETTEGWARMYPFMMDPSLHVDRFADIMVEEIEKIQSGELQEHLDLQSKIYTSRWNWDYRINEWLELLDELQ